MVSGQYGHVDRTAAIDLEEDLSLSHDFCGAVPRQYIPAVERVFAALNEGVL